MFELWETADLKSYLLKLGQAFAGGRVEIEHNGERVKYASKYEMKMAGTEISKELRRRGELARPGEEQAQAPARVLYTYQTGNP